MGSSAGLDGCGNLNLTGIRSPDRPVRSELLYRLSYPSPYVYIYISLAEKLEENKNLEDQEVDRKTTLILYMCM